MKVNKYVNGVDVELELIKIKDYPRYSLYNVCKDGEVLYKETFTPLQIRSIVLNGYRIKLSWYEQGGIEMYVVRVGNFYIDSLLLTADTYVGEIVVSKERARTFKKGTAEMLADMINGTVEEIEESDE